jgi:hypothetical protein
MDGDGAGKGGDEDAAVALELEDLGERNAGRV